MPPSEELSDITSQDIRRAVWCGGGGFGEVFVLEHSTLGKVALKKLREFGSSDDVAAQRWRAKKEAGTWKRLRHAHILPFMGVIETEDSFYIASPFAEKGSLTDHIRAHPDTNRLRLITECASALTYLHSQDIIHGDIKAANVLISADERAMLCDFGLARAVDSATSTTLVGKGTLRWMSPELLEQGQGRTFASDVWAFGMLIYEVLSGLPPYHDVADYGVYQVILIKHLRPPKSPSHSANGISYDIPWKVAEDCWNQNPIARPSMHIVHSSFLFTGSLEPSRPAALNTPELRWCNSTNDAVLSAAFSSDSAVLVAASRDGNLRFWDTPSGRQHGSALAAYSGHVNGAVNSVAFAPNGWGLVSGADDNLVRLWSLTTERFDQTPLAGHTNSVQSVSFSPDGRLILSAGIDRTIRVWDTVSKKQVAVLEGHSEPVYSVAWSPTARTIASASSEPSVYLWDAAMMRRSGQLNGHTKWLSSVAFSPDGKILASASGDLTVRLWDTQSGTGTGQMSHAGYIRSLSFSTDGSRLAAGADDCSMLLWDITSPASPSSATVLGHGGRVLAVTHSPDGLSIASGCADWNLRLWNRYSPNSPEGEV